ncbi:MAG TPA: PQQ-dependent sugar dehydrogenase [Gemmatimonadaceae bacterium]
MTRETLRQGAAMLALATLAACGGTDRRTDRGPGGAAGDTTSAAAGGEVARCAHGDDALRLPDGFCAEIFADSVGGARDIAVAPNGDVFVQLISAKRGAEGGSGSGGIVALRDVNHDGRADTSARFGAVGGTGIGIHDGHLYADQRTRIVRWTLPDGSLTPTGDPQAIVIDLPTGGHEARNFTFDGSGALYVNVGSNTNSCQVKDRTRGSPGHDPCTELETRAGIWRFDANRAGQTQRTGEHFATGIRNAMGLVVSPIDGAIYATQHGRDQLFQNWPDHFDAKAGAENPAEELVQVRKGDDFGWPYCFYSMEARKLVLAPEYGGDGRAVGRCASKREPLAVFPGHWAPMSALVYTGTMFPPRYRGGVFVAFHGSWNRAPEPQAGYRVVFVPMKDGKPSGAYETFANGFGGAAPSPSSAAHRPVGLAQAPDGAVFVTDDKGGRIWRITYVGGR